MKRPGWRDFLTEAEWLRCTDPYRMMHYLDWGLGIVSERKRRLFAIACSRLVWGLLDEAGRSAVEAAERYVEGQATREEMLAASEAAMLAAQAMPHGDDGLGEGDAIACAGLAAADRPGVAWPGQPSGDNWTPRWGRERAAQCPLLRDLFDPHHPVEIDPAWLAGGSGAVTRLARAAYEERLLPGGHLDAARLAVLADALEDAGCTDPGLLGHLRVPGPHVRGCFVVDLLLAKA
jgi:hypothetical protein